MIVRDLSAETVARMQRIDLAGASEEPESPMEPFEFHGCLCGVGGFVGRPPWELHTAGDELLHVLAGGCRLVIRQHGSEIIRDLRAGDVVVVPQGCWHSTDAPDGVTFLFMTPRDGNQHAWEDPQT